MHTNVYIEQCSVSSKAADEAPPCVSDPVAMETVGMADDRLFSMARPGRSGRPVSARPVSCIAAI